MVSWKDLDDMAKSINTIKEYEQQIVGTDFAAKVIKARQKQNMTQAELAAKSGLKQSAISRIESKGSLPRIDTVYKIAHALNLEIDFYPKDLSSLIDNQLKIDILIDKISNLELTLKELSERVHTLTKQQNVRTFYVYDNDIPRDSYKLKSIQSTRYTEGFYFKEQKGVKKHECWSQ